jgi:Fe-S cluster assembly iron-binding protein IscA
VLQLVLGNLQADGHQAAMASVKDSWQMDAQQKLESMEVLVDNNSVLRLNGLSLDAAMQDKGSLVDMRYHSRAEKGQLGRSTMPLPSGMRMDFSYANINKQGYADWQSRINQLYASSGNADARHAAGQRTGAGQCQQPAGQFACLPDRPVWLPDRQGRAAWQP